MPDAGPSNLEPTTAASVFDIDVLRVARVYAQALMRAAQKANKVDLMQQHFDDLFGHSQPQRDNPADVGALMTSSLIPRGRKGQVIRDAFRGRVDDLFLDFVLVLNRHDRLDLIRAIGTEFRELRDELYRRVRVQVRSAVPLTDEQREQVKAGARTAFHMEPVLVETVDPSLIGGLQIQIGDKMFDLSLRSRLQKIKNQLIARSSHEIQRRRDRIGT